MIGLIIAVIIFNFITFKTNKKLTLNQIVHIWVFTIAFQLLADLFIDKKFHGYWYFSKGVDWESIPALIVLIPPVNIMFLNRYPFQSKMIKKVLYIIFWVIGMLIYECITLLPEPWGYFHYGWWKLWYSSLVDPLLLTIVLNYYKWIRRVEKKVGN